MKKALLLSVLLILALGCSLSNIVDEVTRVEEQPLEQIEPRQEQPTAEYRSHNDPAANKDVQDTLPFSQAKSIHLHLIRPTRFHLIRPTRFTLMTSQALKVAGMSKVQITFIQIMLMAHFI